MQTIIVGILLLMFLGWMLEAIMENIIGPIFESLIKVFILPPLDFIYKKINDK